MSPKTVLLKVLSEEKIVGEEDMEKKKYDEGVGCGRTNQQIDLHMCVCSYAFILVDQPF